MKWGTLPGGVMPGYLRRRRLGGVVLRTILLAYLTVWLGLLPLFQGLHLRFASHTHRYCPLHNQIEVVRQSQSRDYLDLLVQGSKEKRIEGLAALPAEEKHVPCALSNYYFSRNPSTEAKALPSLAPQAEWTEVAFLDLDSGSPVAILLNAPKHSPPWVF